MREQVWSVTSLVKYVKRSLDNDLTVQSIFIQGEISNFTHHRSGHMYFSLKDDGAKMNCIMWASNASRLKITPKEGMKVIVQANVSMYEPQGNVQLYVTAMQSDGIGDLYLQFEELKNKLAKEGLFKEEYKKRLPLFPKSIAIISAKTGAAIQDVLSIIARRWPIAHVQVYPTLVQGEQASASIMQQLELADEGNHDVILLVRGGGSIEDLWCFNNEALARYIFSMQTCIVCGVGHETDTTLVDYVCDQRAPTPSAAAELITPDRIEVKQRLLQTQLRMQQKMAGLLQTHRQQWEHMRAKPVLSDRNYFVQNKRMQLDMYIQRLSNVEKRVIEYQKDVSFLETRLLNGFIEFKKQQQVSLQKQIALLDAFSPLKILQRGYSITMKDTHVVKSVHDLNEKDTIQIQLQDGEVKASVVERKVQNERNDI